MVQLLTDNRLLHRTQALLELAFVVALVFVLLLALASGAVPVQLTDLITGGLSEMEAIVLYEIRAPRVALAMVVGAALGCGGAVLQGLFRNPLADPGLIGVSSGAAVGAIAMILFGSKIALSDALSPYATSLAAVAGAIAATGFLMLFSHRGDKFSVVTMLLVGIAINAIANVSIGLFQYLSDDVQLRTLVFWMMGSFARASWSSVLPGAALVCAALIVMLRGARSLDLLQLGDAQALHLGVNVERLKKQLIIAAATAVAAGVALSGIIGFVGLVVPHLVRLLGGASHRYVLPGSALLGGALLVLADLIARTVAIPAEVPVGLVTSAIGAPVFLWLIARARML